MIVNITTYTDADFAQSFVHQSALGAAIDLTDNFLHMMVRSRAEDASVFLTLDTNNRAIIITNAALGAFSLYIPQSILLHLPVGEYVHSLIKADVSSHRIEMWRGTLIHAAGPTRWKVGDQ